MQLTFSPRELIGDLPLPSEPTAYWAGSAEKIELMRQRIEAGYHLFHPCDSKNVMASQKDLDPEELTPVQKQRTTRWLAQWAS